MLNYINEALSKLKMLSDAMLFPHYFAREIDRVLMTAEQTRIMQYFSHAKSSLIYFKVMWKLPFLKTWIELGKSKVSSQILGQCQCDLIKKNASYMSTTITNHY